jgi:sugar/nucleoside kinase (ribokinase family)
LTLVGVGHALADAFAFVEEDVPKTLGLHPGSFNRVPDYRMRAILATLNDTVLMAGGSAANTLKLAARLGINAHFVGQCGHDEAAQVFESELLGAGVKVNLTRIDSPTGLCITFLSPPSQRTVATFRSASGDLAVGLLGDTLLAAADVVVLEGYLLDEPAFLDELLARCLASRKAVAFDIAEGSLVARHREDLLRHLNAGAIRYFFLPEADAATLTGLGAEDALAVLSGSRTTVVLKQGELGYLVRQNGKAVLVPGVNAPVRDATGTDDGFQAGFLWAVGQGWSPVDACRAGALIAACVGEEPGTRVDNERWNRLMHDLQTLAGP